jgi:hypothetical protein
MTRFQLTENSNVVVDIEHVPKNHILLNVPDNPYTQEYNEWLAAGNIPGSDYLREVLIPINAACRYECEWRGYVEHKSKHFHTSRESRNNILNSLLNLQNDQTILWKSVDGSFIELQKSDLTEVNNKIFDYVNTCFEKEYVLGEYIKHSISLYEFDLYAEWNSFLNENGLENLFSNEPNPTLINPTTLI